MKMGTKRTPEELKQQRTNSLIKARATAAANRAARVQTAASVPAAPKASAASKSVAPTQEFAGITQRDCPAGCTENACIITGKPICGHPCKGGIQALHKTDPRIVERYNRAVGHLEHVKLDQRLDQRS